MVHALSQRHWTRHWTLGIGTYHGGPPVADCRGSSGGCIPIQGPDWDAPVLRPGKLVLYRHGLHVRGTASRATAEENVRWPFGPDQ